MKTTRRPLFWSVVALLAAFVVTGTANSQVAPTGVPIVAKDIFSTGSDIEMTELNQVVYERDCAGRAVEYKTTSSSRNTGTIVQVNKLKRVNGEKIKGIRIVNLTSGATKEFKNKDLGKNTLDLTLNDPKNGFSLSEGQNEIQVQLLGKKVKDPLTKVKERMILYTETHIVNVTKTVKDLPATTQNVCSYSGYRYWRYSEYHYYWHSHAWYSYRYNRRWEWYSPYSPYHWRVGYHHNRRDHWYPNWRTRHTPPRVVVRNRHGGVSNPGTGRSRNGTRVSVPPRRRNPGTGPVTRRPIPRTTPRPIPRTSPRTTPRTNPRGGVSNPGTGVGSSGNRGTTRPAPTTRPTTRPSSPAPTTRPTTRPSSPAPTTRPTTRPSSPAPTTRPTTRPSRPAPSTRPSSPTPSTRPSRPSSPSGGSTSGSSRPSRPSGGGGGSRRKRNG